MLLASARARERERGERERNSAREESCAAEVN